MTVVAFDARPLAPSTRHWGVAAFIEGVTRRLESRFRFVGLAPRFPPPPGREMRTWPGIPRANRAFYELSGWFGAYDVFWGTDHYLPLTLRGPSVVTVHDLLLVNGIESPPVLARARMVSSIRRADVIAANSRSTAAQLGTVFPELRPKIEVVLHGFTRVGGAPRSSRGAPPGGPQRESGPYVVMLGCHRPRKNPGLALEVVALARDAGTDVSLIVTGSIFPGFRGLFASAPRWVKCAGVLPRERVEELLGGASALLFPSVYEGFGLPILEAMAAGCPVLGLDTPSNREIGGGAALLSDDPGKWVSWIRDLTGTGHLRAELRERGLDNLNRFSWDETAAGYDRIFQRLASR